MIPLRVALDVRLSPENTGLAAIVCSVCYGELIGSKNPMDDCQKCALWVTCDRTARLNFLGSRVARDACVRIPLFLPVATRFHLVGISKLKTRCHKRKLAPTRGWGRLFLPTVSPPPCGDTISSCRNQHVENLLPQESIVSESAR